MSLEEVDQYIQKNKRLPNIPSELEVAMTGFNVGDMHNRLLEKIEELTLHTIAQDKLIKEQQKVLNHQIARIEKLESINLEREK